MPASTHSDAPRRSTVRRPAAVVLAALALLLGLTSVAVAGPGGTTAPARDRYEVAESVTGLYIVVLEDAPLSMYRGGIDGLAPTAPSALGETRLNLSSPASIAYRAYLATQRETVLGRITSALGREVTVAPGYVLDVALNGFIAKLTHAEANTVAGVAGVRAVEADSTMDFVTDVGPEWIDAPTIWGKSGNEELLETGANGCGSTDQTAQISLPAEPTTSCGEGIVVGIIDTGINSGHPSFADLGGDNYDHTNPRAHPDDTRPDFYGEDFGGCDATTGEGQAEGSGCNDKLIGIYDFTEGCVLLGECNPEDDNGHGSHTASTTAGNVLDATIVSPTLALTRTISGVAPHANIISYKGCQTTVSDPAGLLIGCELTNGAVVSALVASIDQAVEDEVDVINFSIGGGPADPYAQPTDPAFPSISLAFLGANEAGVFSAVSAGNSGPDELTVGYPSNSPWVMTVGASTHNRRLTNGVIDLSSEDVPQPGGEDAAFFGVSFSCGYPQDPPMDNYAEDCTTDEVAPEGTAPIVWAGDYESPDPTLQSIQGDCGNGPPQGANLESSIDPFPDSVDFNGAIVVCIRGVYARVNKAEMVAENGAGGFILINQESSGNSLVADPYEIPGVHLTYEDGQLLWDEDDDEDGWLETAPDRGENPVPEDYSRQAAIQGTTPDVSPANGDIMASFSSRGPNEPLQDVIKPDITAPGVDVLAAWMGDEVGDDFNIISGTSMSSPHTAGAGALVRALHPDWTPDEIKSAIMLSSFNYMPSKDGVHGLEEHDVLKEDGETSADPFDMGAGRVDLSRAGTSGLIMTTDLDPEVSEYEASDPDDGGDPRTLNLPSMADDECVQTCSWTRTVEGTAGADIMWTVSVVEPDGVQLTVEPSSFTVGEGETATFTVTATILDATLDEWHFGQVVLSPGDTSVLGGDMSTQAVNPELVTALHMPVAVFATEEGTAQSPGPTATVVPTVAPSQPPTATATEGGPPPPTPTPSPRARFIPDTAGEWIGTPAGMATTLSLAILIGSLVMLAAPRARAWRKSRR